MQLTISNLSKQYSAQVYGLRDVSLNLSAGVLGLVGPNGAGKSTLMRILATISTPTHGSVLWNGVDISKSANELRVVLGYLPQDFGVYPNLSPIEFLSYLAALKGLTATAAKKRIDELLCLVNLTDVRNRALGTFSGGMRQRVGIAQALLNDPHLLIVDEPTVGLDPQERVRFRNLLSDLAGERIVILSTHIVADIETLTRDLAILSRGSLLYHGGLESLLRTVEGKTWELAADLNEVAALRQRYQISSLMRRGNRAYLRVIQDAAPAAAEVRQVPPTLEEAYLYTVASPGAAGSPRAPSAPSVGALR